MSAHMGHIELWGYRSFEHQEMSILTKFSSLTASTIKWSFINDNFRWSQCRRFRQNFSVSISSLVKWRWHSRRLTFARWWKHFPRYWPFVRGIHRSPMTSPHKGQWRGALMFSLICAWINGWVNTGEAGDLRRHRAQYDVTLMIWFA